MDIKIGPLVCEAAWCHIRGESVVIRGIHLKPAFCTALLNGILAITRDIQCSPSGHTVACLKLSPLPMVHVFTDSGGKDASIGAILLTLS